jgi:hypothetical protein
MYVAVELHFPAMLLYFFELRVKGFLDFHLKISSSNKIPPYKATTIE